MAFGSVTAVYVRKQQQLQADRRSRRRKTHQKQQEISSQSNQPAREMAKESKNQYRFCSQCFLQILGGSRKLFGKVFPSKEAKK